MVVVVSEQSLTHHPTLQVIWEVEVGVALVHVVADIGRLMFCWLHVVHPCCQMLWNRTKKSERCFYDSLPSSSSAIDLVWPSFVYTRSLSLLFTRFRYALSLSLSLKICLLP